jgi:hypothetical protein
VTVGVGVLLRFNLPCAAGLVAAAKPAFAWESIAGLAK